MDETHREIANHLTSEASDRFWHLIHLARNDRPKFIERLGQLSQDELRRLYWTYRAAMSVLQFDPYAQYFDSDLSEDGIDDLCRWIVAQGKEYYRKIIDDPTSTPPNCHHDRPTVRTALSEIVLAGDDDVTEDPDDDPFF